MSHSLIPQQDVHCYIALKDTNTHNGNRFDISFQIRTVSPFHLLPLLDSNFMIILQIIYNSFILIYIQQKLFA